MTDLFLQVKSVFAQKKIRIRCVLFIGDEMFFIVSVVCFNTIFMSMLNVLQPPLMGRYFVFQCPKNPNSYPPQTDTSLHHSLLDICTLIAFHHIVSQCPVFFFNLV